MLHAASKFYELILLVIFIHCTPNPNLYFSFACRQLCFILTCRYHLSLAPSRLNHAEFAPKDAVSPVFGSMETVASLCSL